MPKLDEKDLTNLCKHVPCRVELFHSNVCFGVENSWPKKHFGKPNFNSLEEEEQDYIRRKMEQEGVRLHEKYVNSTRLEKRRLKRTFRALAERYELKYQKNCFEKLKALERPQTKECDPLSNDQNEALLNDQNEALSDDQNEANSEDEHSEWGYSLETVKRMPISQLPPVQIATIDSNDNDLVIDVDESSMPIEYNEQVSSFLPTQSLSERRKRYVPIDTESLAYSTPRNSQQEKYSAPRDSQQELYSTPRNSQLEAYPDTQQIDVVNVTNSQIVSVTNCISYEDLFEVSSVHSSQFNSQKFTGLTSTQQSQKT